MTFRFFGDSWFWSWYQTHMFQSESLKNNDEYMYAQSHIRTLLTDMGHTVVSNCIPGASFSQTSRIIENLNSLLCPPNQKNEIWVVFVSSDLRKPDTREAFRHPDWNLTSKSIFLEQLDTYMLHNLNRIIMDADSNRTLDIILVGGQSSMPEHIFNQRFNKTNRVHLLSECILKDLLPYLADTVGDACNEFPRFMFECEFGRIYDDFCDRNPLSTVDPDLIEHLGKELDPDMENVVRNFLMWPDNAHLGATGQLFFVDYLLKFCEDKGILKT